MELLPASPSHLAKLLGGERAHPKRPKRPWNHPHQEKPRPNPSKKGTKRPPSTLPAPSPLSDLTCRPPQSLLPQGTEGTEGAPLGPLGHRVDADPRRRGARRNAIRTTPPRGADGFSRGVAWRGALFGVQSYSCQRVVVSSDLPSRIRSWICLEVWVFWRYSYWNS